MKEEEIFEVASLEEAIPISKEKIKKLFKKNEFKPFSFKIKLSDRFDTIIYRIDVKTINGSFDIIIEDKKSKSRKISDYVDE